MANQANSGLETVEQGATTWRETINKDLFIIDRLMAMTKDVISDDPGSTGWTTVKTYSIPNFIENVFPFIGHGLQVTVVATFLNTPSEVKDVRIVLQRDSDAVIPLLTMGSVAHAAGEGVYLDFAVAFKT